MAYIRDITERKAAEKAAAASEERFRALLDSAPDAAVIVDDGGQIALINEQTERLFGYPREELIGRSVEVLLPDQLRAIHIAHRNGYLADPKTRAIGAGLELAGRQMGRADVSTPVTPRARTPAGACKHNAYLRDFSRRQAT